MVERNGPIEILLVEDNPGDVRLTKEALKEGKVYSNLHTCKDGVEAMEFLRRQGKYSSAPRPDIILLDLNLPRKDGREVLEEKLVDEGESLLPRVAEVLAGTPFESESLAAARAVLDGVNTYFTRQPPPGTMYAMRAQAVETAAAGTGAVAA